MNGPKPTNKDLQQKKPIQFVPTTPKTQTENVKKLELSKQRIGDSVCIISMSCEDETNGANQSKAGWKR